MDGNRFELLEGERGDLYVCEWSKDFDVVWAGRFSDPYEAACTWAEIAGDVSDPRTEGWPSEPDAVAACESGEGLTRVGSTHWRETDPPYGIDADYCGEAGRAVLAELADDDEEDGA